MVFTADSMAGFLSGGCVEADVALHARATLIDGKPRKLLYGRGSPFYDIQLQCGSSITIAIERVTPSHPVVARLRQAIVARKDILLISNGFSRLASGTLMEFPSELRPSQEALQSSSNGGRIGPEHYWVRYRPRIRLVIIGADPAALAIAQLAKQAEFEVIFARPQGPRLPPPVAPEIYRSTTIRSVFGEFGLDHRTAVVFANHDFASVREDVALALKSRAGYIGMIGSRRQRPLKDDGLRQCGLEDEEIARFTSPAGLDVGKSSPFAIAISLIAEILLVMNKNPVAFGMEVHPLSFGLPI